MLNRLNPTGIFGGALLGVKDTSSLSFYDWETTTLTRRIDIEAKNVIWSESGEMVAIITATSFFVLKFKREVGG